MADIAFCDSWAPSKEHMCRNRGKYEVGDHLYCRAHKRKHYEPPKGGGKEGMMPDKPATPSGGSTPPVVYTGRVHDERRRNWLWPLAAVLIVAILVFAWIFTRQESSIAGPKDPVASVVVDGPSCFGECELFERILQLLENRNEPTTCDPTTVTEEEEHVFVLCGGVVIHIDLSDLVDVNVYGGDSISSVDITGGTTSTPTSPSTTSTTTGGGEGSTTTTTTVPSSTTTVAPSTTTTTVAQTTTTTTTQPKVNPIARASDPGDLAIVDSSVNVCLSDNGSFDPDGGNIVSYSWTSSQGLGSRTGTAPCWQVSQPDVYTFTLTVTDDEGATDSDSVTVSVIEFGSN